MSVGGVGREGGTLYLVCVVSVRRWVCPSVLLNGVDGIEWGERGRRSTAAEREESAEGGRHQLVGAWADRRLRTCLRLCSGALFAAGQTERQLHGAEGGRPTADEGDGNDSRWPKFRCNCHWIQHTSQEGTPHRLCPFSPLSLSLSLFETLPLSACLFNSFLLRSPLARLDANSVSQKNVSSLEEDEHKKFVIFPKVSKFFFVADSLSLLPCCWHRRANC